jgi:pimeloyl-ACP methyl ester carboxylesterase
MLQSYSSNVVDGRLRPNQHDGHLLEHNNDSILSKLLTAEKAAWELRRSPIHPSGLSTPSKNPVLTPAATTTAATATTFILPSNAVDDISTDTIATTIATKLTSFSSLDRNTTTAKTYDASPTTTTTSTNNTDGNNNANRKWYRTSSSRNNKNQDTMESDHSDTTTTTQNPHGYLPPLRTAIVYRYYARQKARTVSAGSIPFVLLGPNVDHWKMVGQQLAARGFNVIAVGPKDGVLPTTTVSPTGTVVPDSTSTSSSSSFERYLEGPALVLQLLDALRWNKIVLVGCDREAALAIQAALHLAPHRIAGLILCGNLDDSENIYVGYNNNNNNNDHKSGLQPPHHPLELDRYLHERLVCPFTIVWDGTTERIPDGPSVSTLYNSEAPFMTTTTTTATNIYTGHHRSVIIGGGTAPHRRRPGIFAWILTRFVEEQIAPTIPVAVVRGTATIRTPRPTTPTRHHKDTTSKTTSFLPLWLSSSPLWRYPARIPVLWNVDDMFNEESMVVFGRIVATAIFYAISLQVIFYQYGNVRDGMDWITSTHRMIVATIQNRTSNVLSLLLMIGRLPSVLVSFWNAITPNDDKEVVSMKGLQSESSNMNSNNNNTSNNEESDEGEDKQDESTENEIRPLFFLDHVVA